MTLVIIEKGGIPRLTNVKKILIKLDYLHILIWYVIHARVSDIFVFIIKQI